MTTALTHDSRTALARARFFLERAEACTGEERVEFEAYLEAAIVFARAAVHRAQTRYRRRAGWREWWESLASDPAVNFFRTERDWILKEAPPRVGQKVFLGTAGGSEPPYAPARASEFYFFENANTAAAVTVARHLAAIERHLLDADHRFSSAGDTT